jgi:multiple sugar transport system permease protein/raffinose/stachyose/melibiose transport system permease protein
MGGSIRKGERVAYFFILPNVVVYGIFIFIPTVFTVYLSFTNYNLFKSSWVGLHNYVAMFHDSVFVQSIWNTVRFALGSIVPNIAIGLLLAVLLNNAVTGRKVFRTVFFLPYVISIVSASMAWLYILDGSPYGLLNSLIGGIGMTPRQWLLDPSLAMPSVIVMSIWIQIGFTMIVYLGGLQGVPPELYESARMDGATPFRMFFAITLPLLRPTTFFLVVMTTIAAFQVFGQVYILTGGGPLNTTSTIVYQVYINGFTGYQMGYASAEAVLLLVIILAVTFANFAYGNKGESSGLG